MDKVTEVARYLIYSYEVYSNYSFENQELKLQKLMYFIQRESFALTGKAMFQDDFEGWKHGPVLPVLRGYFEENYKPYDINSSKLGETEKYIIESVIHKYGMYDAWYLRNLSHEEQSWINSRKGLSDNQAGNVLISKDDIKEDAKKVKIYDYQYDMYLNEFEDFEGEVLP